MKKKKKYEGVVVPMLSPFTAKLTVDEEAVEKIVNHLLKENCQPFVLGTTGESSSIPITEKLNLVKRTVEATKQKTPVYAGISSNCYTESIELAQRFQELGADVAVAHVPGYYALDQDQILKYFELLASNISMPLIIYNMPITTHMSLDVEIIEKLSKHENIVGIKDSERGEERLNRSISLWKDREDFSYLLGWAAKSYEALKLGADGIVPSSGNLVPRLYSLIGEHIASGKDQEAQKAQEKADAVSKVYQQYQPLSKGFPYFKAMMSKYGLCQKYVMPPLQSLDDKASRKAGDQVSGFGETLTKLNQIENVSV